MERITYDDFTKVEFRVGKIVEAKEVDRSEKLIRLIVDFGDELGQKIVYSGIRQWYSPADLLNKKTIFIVNMVPKKIMGEESEAMIFGAEDEEKSEMSILILEKDLPAGTKVF